VKSPGRRPAPVLPVPPPRRLYTADEANAVLPEVRTELERVRGHVSRAQEVRELLDDLEAYYGGDMASATQAERDRHAALRGEASRLEAEISEGVRGILDRGIEIKDLQRGLIDFYHDRAGTVVYLCWEHGEKRVLHWHPLASGYAGRQPLP